MDSVECVVVGAGVIGLAVARALALSGREVVVLESAPVVGAGISSRNSEVIHAGIYYPQGSLKARLCVQGKSLLQAFCDERHVAWRRCGKLIVATRPDQLDELRAIAEHAQRNGVHDLVWLSAAQAQALEPELHCDAALLSPGTGVLDSHALMLALWADLEGAGGLLALNTTLARVAAGPQGYELHCADGACLGARWLVNAAGLAAPALAQRIAGLAPHHIPAPSFAKGNYFSFTGRCPFSRLIYPVPEPGGLGVHLTLDLGGQARFGPDVQWVDSPDDLAVDPARAPAFEAEVRRYWPGLPDRVLQPGYAGIRPKISGPGQPAADFVIQDAAAHGLPGLVNLFGIESPGLTACLAIGEEVARRLLR